MKNFWKAFLNFILPYMNGANLFYCIEYTFVHQHQTVNIDKEILIAIAFTLSFTFLLLQSLTFIYDQFFSNETANTEDLNLKENK